MYLFIYASLVKMHTFHCLIIQQLLDLPELNLLSFLFVFVLFIFFVQVYNTIFPN